MRMREIIGLIEASQANPFMRMWDFIKYYDLDHAKAEFHDAMLPWINSNSPRCIDRGIKRTDYRLLSKLTFWKDQMVRERDWNKEFATIPDFEAALSTPVTIWRGGPGIYNPDFSKRGWASFTANRARTKTFTHYNGTYTSHAQFLNRRDGPFWVVELTLPLDSILLYLDQGSDDEVIVSKKDAQMAKVIESGDIGNDTPHPIMISETHDLVLKLQQSYRAPKSALDYDGDKFAAYEIFCGDRRIGEITVQIGKNFVTVRNSIIYLNDMTGKGYGKNAYRQIAALYGNKTLRSSYDVDTRYGGHTRGLSVQAQAMWNSFVSKGEARREETNDGRFYYVMIARDASPHE